MSEGVWIRKYELSWLEWLGVNVVKRGQVPRHIAVIMDGNRRFARQAGQEVISGHKAGFNKLAETLQWCRELGVREVTVYAFSIENFNRAQTEVSDLLNLAKDKFLTLLEESEKLKEAGVRVRILGNTSYLPQDLQEVLQQVENTTRDNSESLLNIALSYTAREEISHAMREVAGQLARGEVDDEDVDEGMISKMLYTGDSPSPELLIRTSGETRLSDFMLWQASKSITYFSPVLWPEFSLWQLLSGIFFFQRQNKKLEELLEDENSMIDSQEQSWRMLEQRRQVSSVLESWTHSTA